ncbi:MAG: PLP-dependent aminotransferase family protein [Ignavibacteriae bacterium]|nr:MAG: PLP-dependent aminotransferase family protein [Ignavibacteriota bacterium]
MKNLFADRMENVPASFIREILKFTQSKDVISFAGGLPNPAFFPVEDIKKSAVKVLEADGTRVLQYAETEGHLPLREYISDYMLRRKNLKVPVEEIQITNGSQQAIALICKTFLNKGETVVLERPSYLGAIQAISFYEPEFHTVELEDDGINIEELESTLEAHPAKLFYSVPNFNNPSGITWSLEKRQEVARILSNHEMIYFEDDPYYEVRYEGEHLPSVKSFYDKNVILTSSFSKMVAPGFRIGWICAQKDLMEKIVISKQAADLQPGTFAQRVLHQYLTDYNIENHLVKIRETYKRQKDKMVEMMKQELPEEVKFTNPQGGMFLWATMPENASCRDVLSITIEKKVVFVPGDTFYVDGKGFNCMRLNFSNSPEEKIVKGVKILADAMKEVIAKHNKLKTVPV